MLFAWTECWGMKRLLQGKFELGLAKVRVWVEFVSTYMRMSFLAKDTRGPNCPCKLQHMQVITCNMYMGTSLTVLGTVFALLLGAPSEKTGCLARTDPSLLIPTRTHVSCIRSHWLKLLAVRTHKRLCVHPYVGAHYRKVLMTTWLFGEAQVLKNTWIEFWGPI